MSKRRNIDYAAHIDFGKVTGPIKPIHGVNNGPTQWSLGHPRDMSGYYREMHIPYSRLHDTEWPNGSQLFVDIHCVFPDFSADENDPASYYFFYTDQLIAAIYKAGGKAFYRLGESIECLTDRPLNILPPADFHKWARVCEHIIRHYNEGWAKGFHYGIEYWEIWNEAEGWEMWRGTREDFYRLYSITANHLRTCFGDTIKIGGPSVSSLYALVEPTDEPWPNSLIENADNFMAYINAPETKAPLDFFSFHCYKEEPSEYYQYIRTVRRWLDDRGHKDAELILNEWSPAWHWSELQKHDVFAAARIASILVAGQYSPVDMMNFYDLRTTSTLNALVDHYMQPYGGYYGFVGFGDLYELGQQVESGSFSVEDDVYVLAAKDEAGKHGRILLVKQYPDPTKVTLKIEGFAGEEISVKSLSQTASPHHPTPLYFEQEQNEDGTVTVRFSLDGELGIATVELR